MKCRAVREAGKGAGFCTLATHTHTHTQTHTHKDTASVNTVHISTRGMKAMNHRTAYPEEYSYTLKSLFIYINNFNDPVKSFFTLSEEVPCERVGI